MEQAGAFAKIKGNTSANEAKTVHCMPLYSILLALNETIDYFSLDIEGQELAVLQTLPFDKIDVKVMRIK
jgi:Methyltransferase FkbM domain